MLTAPRRVPDPRLRGRPPGPGASSHGPDDADGASSRARRPGRRRDQGLAERGGRPDAHRCRARRDLSTRRIARDLPVTAHAQGAGQVERALGAGDRRVRAHAVDRAALRRRGRVAAAKRMRIVSTLDIQSFGGDTPELRTAVDNLRRFRAAGGSRALRHRPRQRRDPGRDPPARGAPAPRGRVSQTEAILQAMARGPLAVGRARRPDRARSEPVRGARAFDDLRLVVRGRRLIA